jgi:hypothetical protein
MIAIPLATTRTLAAVSGATGPAAALRNGTALPITSAIAPAAAIRLGAIRLGAMGLTAKGLATAAIGLSVSMPAAIRGAAAASAAIGRSAPALVAHPRLGDSGAGQQQGRRGHAGNQQCCPAIATTPACMVHGSALRNAPTCR